MPSRFSLSTLLSPASWHFYQQILYSLISFVIIVIVNVNSESYNHNYYLEPQHVYDTGTTGFNSQQEKLHYEQPKKIRFPKGSKLTVSPKLKIPLLGDSEIKEILGSDFTFAFDFTINLDKLGEHYLDLFNIKRSLGKNSNGMSMLKSLLNSQLLNKSKKYYRNHIGDEPTYNYLNMNFTNPSISASSAFLPMMSNNLMEGTQRSRIYKKRNPNNIPRNKREVGTSTTTTTNFDERVFIIRKLESLLESFGWGSSGRSCLLRAICEIHEFFIFHNNNNIYNVAGSKFKNGSNYNYDGYGILGEMIILLLSISKTSASTQTILDEHLKAEQDGISRNCSNYWKNCSKSIFS